MTNTLDLTPATRWFSQQFELINVYAIRRIITSRKPEWEPCYEDSIKMYKHLMACNTACYKALKKAASAGTLTTKYMIKILDYYTTDTGVYAGSDGYD